MPQRRASNSIASTLRTLLVNGYTANAVTRISTRATLISVQKRDKLGGIATATLLFAQTVGTNLLEMLRKTAEAASAQPLVVTDASVTGIPVMTPQSFYESLGGEVKSDRVTRDDLPDIMNSLGLNRVPSTLSGNADDLLEDYVKESIEFLLESKGWRYGQERLFESLPDGLILGRNSLNLYFDAKAYEKGYRPSADDIKRFAGYVNDFNARYSSYLGRVHSFLMVSGNFTGGSSARENKATQFYSLCGTHLAQVSAIDLGRIVVNVRKKCPTRSAIAWSNILSHRVITPTVVEAEIRRIAKDKIL